MSKFPSYDLSLADGSRLTLASADDASAALLAQFAAAAQLEAAKETGLSQAKGNRKSLFVTTKGHPAAGQTIGENVYEFIPAKKDSDFLCNMLGLSQAVAWQTRSGVLLHGALAEYEGRGVILAARGGTGKTTASQRLPPPWRSLCDDITLVVRDARGRYWAHPWPTWSRFINDGPGGSWDAQRAVPLSFIFYLHQAKRERVEPIGKGEAAIFLIQSAEQVFFTIKRGLDAERLRGLRLEQFEKLCALARCVPVSELHLSLNGPFWQVMERALGRQREGDDGPAS